MFSNLTLAAGLACCFLAPAFPAQARDARPTVAIANIEVLHGGWTVPPPELGPAIAALITDQLVTAQRFHVVDGEWLVPEEQTGRAVALDRLRATAERGRVDYLVLGTVTQFATEQRRRGAGGLWPKPFLGGGLGMRESRTTIGLTLRVVDVRTGEIVATTSAQGMGRRKGKGLGLLGAFHGLPLAVAAANSISRSRDAMLNDAIQQAAVTAARGLVTSASRFIH